MASEHTITQFSLLPQHSYNSPNLPGLLPKSSQGSLGPTVLLSLLFRVKYGLTCGLSFVTHFTVGQDETWCGCDAIQTEHPDTKEREDFLDQGNECWFA